MQYIMLKSKIHKATVTSSEIEYEGSIEIDEALMEEINLIEYEQVQIYNITNGNRFTTYVIKGKKDSGVIGVKGAAAKLAAKGDRVILVSYSMVDDKEINDFNPRQIVVDDKNNIIKRK